MEKETKKAAHAREVAERLAAKEAERAKQYAFVKNHPVGKAVEPLLKDAVQAAEQDAKAYVERMLPLLEAVGGDINKLAPYPKGNVSQEEYKKAMSKRTFFTIVTKPKEGEPCSYHPNAPQYREPCAEGVAHFIDQDKKAAAFNYEDFQFKLVKKVGDCLTAALDGNHVWDFSILTVKKEGGVVEKWKTQSIVNRSVYGKFFNQYPSRVVK